MNLSFIKPMSLLISAKGKTSKYNFEAIKAMSSAIAKRLNLTYSYNDKENTVYLHLTDNGLIAIESKNQDGEFEIEISSQTSIMGPGFHKLAVDFIDYFSDLSEIELDVTDDTEYYVNRDFQKMRKEHFEVWLGKIVDLLNEKVNKKSDFCINWDLNWPRPKDVHTTFSTPFGRYSIVGMNNTIGTRGLSAFLDVFYPCPFETIDHTRVCFYDLLYNLWVRCYYMPSSRSQEDEEINNKVLSLFDKIINSESPQPIPHESYMEVCRLAGREPRSLTGIPDYKCEFTIGFRKDLMTYTLGNLNFKLPGSFMSFNEDQSWGYWNGYDEDQIVHIYAIGTKDNSQDFLLKNEELVKRETIKGAEYILAYLYGESGRHLTQIQMKSDRQFSLFTITAAVDDNKKSAIEWSEKFLSDMSVSQKRLIEELTTLHNEDHHQEIVDIILHLPSYDVTDEIKGLLARAYNNLEEYKNALDILLDLREKEEDTALWNYRVGYSYFYLDQFEDAKQYFERAVELDPEDEDSIWFISQCQLKNPFTARVAHFWEWFESNSEELKDLVSKKKEGFEKAGELMEAGLAILGEPIYYNIGGKNELTFCVENNTEGYFLYPYLVSAMPESLKKDWHVFPCKQPSDSVDFVFCMYDRKIDIGKIMVSAIYNEDSQCFDLRYYHPELNQLQDRESLNAFYIILELTVGEGAVYNYISEVKSADSPTGMFPLKDLSTAMKYILEENGREYSPDPILTLYSYSCKPEEDEQRIRFDILYGRTRFFILNDEYLEGEHEIYDRFVEKGAEPLMLLYSRPEGMKDEEYREFRNIVSERIQSLIDNSSIKGIFLGDAYGTLDIGYIDLLLFEGNEFFKYISQDEVLDSIFKWDKSRTGGYGVWLKDFTRESKIIRIR